MTLQVLDLPPIDPRTEEILSQARMAFVEKGFDGASMQDLARAAGMSAGNFYRYFSSKAALVEAMIELEMRGAQRRFVELYDAADPIRALRETLRSRIESDACAESQPLWAEITAAAMRKPEIADAILKIENRIVALIIEVFAASKNIPVETATARYETKIRLVFFLIHSTTTEASVRGGLPPAFTALIQEQINQIIDGIVADDPAGA